MKKTILYVNVYIHRTWVHLYKVYFVTNFSNSLLPAVSAYRTVIRHFV